MCINSQASRYRWISLPFFASWMAALSASTHSGTETCPIRRSLGKRVRPNIHIHVFVRSKSQKMASEDEIKVYVAVAVAVAVECRVDIAV